MNIICGAHYKTRILFRGKRHSVTVGFSARVLDTRNWHSRSQLSRPRRVNWFPFLRWPKNRPPECAKGACRKRDASLSWQRPASATTPPLFLVQRICIDRSARKRMARSAAETIRFCIDRESFVISRVASIVSHNDVLEKCSRKNK